MTDQVEQTCRTCLNTREWHEESKPIHPFNNGEAGATAFLGQRDQRDEKTSQRRIQGSPRMAYPMDPVLRQALVDAGVITPEQLRAAEEKIQAITGMFNHGLTTRGEDGQQRRG